MEEANNGAFGSVPLSTSQSGDQKSDFDIYNKTLTTPAVRRVAQENNVDLTAVKGTGRDGRVLKEDVLSYIEIMNSAKSVREQKSANTSPTKSTQKSSSHVHVQTTDLRNNLNETNAFESDRKEAITGIRKSMAKNMTLAQKIPHLGLSDDIDMTFMVNLRPQLKVLGEEHKVKLTYLAFMIKAASEALKNYPILNSSVNDSCDTISYWSDHNIGVAIDTPHGLLVPIVKKVQSLSIIQVAGEIQRLQEKGLKGQLAPDDLSGGTFTLSNIGSVSLFNNNNKWK